MEYLASQIKTKFDNALILNATANDGTRFKNWSSTGDGIDKGGDRIITEINTKLTEYVKNTSVSPTLISFIGSSMGGLYCRYVMGKLYDAESDRIVVKKDDIKIEMKLVNFVALASPLVSVRALVPSWVYYGMKVIFYAGTASQMLLEDDREHPLIAVMNDSESDYFKALASCKQRITVCSAIDSEFKVPYQASAMIPHALKTPKSGLSVSDESLISEYISGYHTDDVGAFCEEFEGKRYYDYESKHYQQMLETMITNLRKMSWVRIDVQLSHAQAAIINENRAVIAQLVCKTFKSKL
jgi:hypothetical protein